MMDPQVHRFDSTGEAYNASQTHDEIRDGDVLYVPSEGVVGVMVSAWPTAITAETGEFHGLDPEFHWSTFAVGRYAESAELARHVEAQGEEAGF